MYTYDYGQNTIIFENVKFLNNIQHGIYLHLILYYVDATEGNPTSYDFTFKDCLVDGAVYGVYLQYYKYSTRPLDAVYVNFDTDTTIKNCRYGFYVANSTTEEARVFTINGGNFINNEIGVYTEGRINIAGNAVIKSNISTIMM